MKVTESLTICSKSEKHLITSTVGVNSYQYVGQQITYLQSNNHHYALTFYYILVTNRGQSWLCIAMEKCCFCKSMWGDVVGLEFNDTDVDSWLALFAFKGYHSIYNGRQGKQQLYLAAK